MLGYLIAGAVAYAVELGLCFVRGFDWFLRIYELPLFALGALVVPALLWAWGLVAVRLAGLPAAARARVVAAGSALLAAAGFAAGMALTSGRWASAWAGRWPLVVGLGLSLGLALPLALRSSAALRARERGTWAAAVLCTLGGALGAVDVWVLPRQYPAFHGLSVLGAFSCFALAATLLPPGGVSRRRLARGAMVTGLAGVLGLWLLATSMNAGFVVKLSAPWTGKAVAAFEGFVPPSGSARTPATDTSADDACGVAPVAPARGIDLRDADVLLITVDALRADVLGAYGGHVQTPAMDALAAEGMVFERAYTPTPHTSYALSSMITGKPLREVMALTEGASDHSTLPESLRRFGYRTAAFFPPAIFFVDGSRFELLSSRNFGFEYLKRMYAPARARVGQVQRYLEKVPEEKPVFVWVHLFEPHEPYHAPEGEAESELPRHRYEAEVRYVDRAVGELVSAFRTARPGATVILSADHGEEFGDHGGLYHGTTLFDEQARVPLIWSSPGVVSPGRSRAPVELHDLASTVLAAAGVARDARMRGDDLGPVLSGAGEGPEYAFASVDEQAMVVDGQYKAICGVHAERCRLYDLEHDPRERNNLAAQEPEVLARLRSALSTHLGSVAREEALPLAEGVGFPEVLARARLGDLEAAEELVPLLGAPKAAVRAQAARTLGELRYEGARVALARLCEQDPDAQVQTEAALASCALGESSCCDGAVSALESDAPTTQRRAALALAAAGRSEGVGVLVAWAKDGRAEERDRVQALSSLRALSARAAEPALIELLQDVRLRPLVAEILGEVGSRAGADALAAQLAEERYPPARAAEVKALLALGDTRAVPLLTHMLGTESGVPGGLDLLRQAGALGARPSARGALLRKGSPALQGTWLCDGPERGCAPGPGAALELPRASRASQRRLVLWTQAPAPVELRLAGTQVRVPAGEGEVNVALEGQPGRVVEVATEEDVRVQGFAVVPHRDDVPPPPPEPWGDQAATAEQVAEP